MNQIVHPLPQAAGAPPPFIPDNAPFTPVQRAWLNGFFAGLFSGDAAASPVPAVEEEEDFPWHDPAMTLAERQALAEGRPLPRRMMAAMAQLDCGQCGFQCQSYAEAIASGAETALTRCVPGGKETARALKALLAEAPKVAPAPKVVATGPERRSVAARFVAATPLNGTGSDKDVRHVVFALPEGATYEAGDSFGIMPRKCPDLASAVLDRLGAGDAALVERIVTSLDIERPSDAAVALLRDAATDPDERARLSAWLDGDEGAAPPGPDLLDLLDAFPSARPEAAALLDRLDPLQPRLYSISSSPRAHRGEVHLTVAAVRWQSNGRQRKGVASCFLAERAQAGMTVDGFLQTAHGFRLPADPARGVIMIGPGTGIAPFRSFLHERAAQGAGGPNWLFFGDQRAKTDFLYRDELDDLARSGTLTRLDTAFSRDQAEKIYVQHRMAAAGADLWRWLEDGAHVYVCGDARRMARDVDQALRDVIAAHGGQDGKAYLDRLTQAGRYQRDVY